MSYHEFSYQGNRILIPQNLTPKKIYIEPSSKCNLNCAMCFRHSWDEPFLDMDYELFKKLLEEIDGFSRKPDIHIGGLGEPFVNPHIYDMLTSLKESGYFVSISSNGTLMPRERMECLIDHGIDRLYLSMDPGVLGHGPVDPVLERLREIDSLRRKKKKGKPMTGVEIVLTKENIAYLPGLVGPLKEAGVTFIILSNLVPTRKQVESQVLYGQDKFENKAYEEFVKKSYTQFNVTLPEFEFRTERRCNFISQDGVVIRSDGEVVPCYRLMYSYEEHYLGIHRKINVKSFGNIKEKSLEEIYNTREYAWFRFVVKNSLYPSCGDCRLRESCDFILSTERDCWGNAPSCSDCLWARRIVICP